MAICHWSAGSGCEWTEAVIQFVKYGVRLVNVFLALDACLVHLGPFGPFGAYLIVLNLQYPLCIILYMISNIHSLSSINYITFFNIQSQFFIIYLPLSIFNY